jgi:hypothetical protein
VWLRQHTGKTVEQVQAAQEAFFTQKDALPAVVCMMKLLAEDALEMALF